MKSVVTVKLPELDYFDGGGYVQMAYKQSHKPSTIPKELIPAIREIENLRSKDCAYIMVNKVPPKTIVPIHTDKLVNGERLERWHLPLITNEHCWFWSQETEMIHMKVGFWYLVKYWEPHSLGNDGETDRIHLIVDLR